MVYDSFPRFLRTKEFEKMIEKYKNDKEVLVLKDTVDYPYKDDSFSNNFVSDKDFEFAKKLLQDNYDWELMGSLTGSLNSYFSVRNVILYYKTSIFRRFHI
jgi:hypothetical protein